MLERQARLASSDSAWPTAVGAYWRLIAGWPPQPLSAPLLLVGPAEPVPGAEGSDRPVVWPAEHTEIRVPGDRFSMMERIPPTSRGQCTTGSPP